MLNYVVLFHIVQIAGLTNNYFHFLNYALIYFCYDPLCSSLFIGLGVFGEKRGLYYNECVTEECNTVEPWLTRLNIIKFWL